MKEFADRLKSLRICAEMTQKEVSAALGLTRNAYGNYENGIREPSLETLIKICKLFKVSADYLLGLEE